MQEISRFYVVVIRMYYDDHEPPHFHAIYSGEEIQVAINPIAILDGELPRRATSLVLEWAALHQRELTENWERLRKDQKPEKITPLK